MLPLFHNTTATIRVTAGMTGVCFQDALRGSYLS